MGAATTLKIIDFCYEYFFEGIGCRPRSRQGGAGGAVADRSQSDADRTHGPGCRRQRNPWKEHGVGSVSELISVGAKVRCISDGQIGVVREVREVWIGERRLHDAVFIDTSETGGIVRSRPDVEPIERADG